MYAAIRHYKLKAGSADVVVQRAQEGFVPLISSLPGFVAYYGVVEENSAVTVSIFTDQAGEEESIRQAASWVKENIAQYVESGPEIVAGEVVLHGQK